MDDAWVSELAAFARAYPANASRLGAPGSDPDIERLADAFDYLASKVRRIVDRGSLELIEPFAELLCPELSRPLPSATILEVIAAPPRSRRLPIAAGAPFGSVPRDGTMCLFRAMSAFDVVPWTMSDARAEWSAEDGQAVVLTLDPVKPTVSIGTLLPLRLYFAAETAAAATLHYWFCKRLTSVELELVGSESRRLTIPVDAVQPWGFDRAEALLPIEPHEHPGFRLLREYFTMPQKFAFAEVQARPLPWSGKAPQVRLVFRFDATLPTGLEITTQTIRLNCVPVINLFDSTTDPIRPSLDRPVHTLRVAGVPMDHAAIYAIRAAEVQLDGEQESRPLPSMLAFGGAPPESLPGAFYTTRAGPARRAETDFCVSLASTADTGAMPPVDFASFDVWATNGTLAATLGAGEICVPSPASPPGLAFRNIRALTSYVPAPRGSAFRERATALMAMSAVHRLDVTRLRCILRGLDPNGLTRTQAGRAEAQRLAAILNVTSATGRIDARGAMIRGEDIEVTLGQGPFQGEGEVFTFASLLDRYFSYEAPINTYTRTSVRWIPTGLVLRFPPRHGGRALV